ncbi:unnamed protein product, partial [Ectocarpus sp. 4 AP-2014]
GGDFFRFSWGGDGTTCSLSPVVPIESLSIAVLCHMGVWCRFLILFCGTPSLFSLSLGVCGVSAALPYRVLLAALFPGCLQRRRRRDFDGLAL